MFSQSPPSIPKVKTRLGNPLQNPTQSISRLVQATSRLMYVFGQNQSTDWHISRLPNSRVDHQSTALAHQSTDPCSQFLHNAPGDYQSTGLSHQSTGPCHQSTDTGHQSTDLLHSTCTALVSLASTLASSSTSLVVFSNEP